MVRGEDQGKVEICCQLDTKDIKYSFCISCPLDASSPHMRELGLKVTVIFGVQEKLWWLSHVFWKCFRSPLDLKMITRENSYFVYFIYFPVQLEVLCQMTHEYFLFFYFYKIISPTRGIPPVNFHICNKYAFRVFPSTLCDNMCLSCLFTCHGPHSSCGTMAIVYHFLTLGWRSVWIWGNHLATISHLEERSWRSSFEIS